jgi:hypothetical protein
MKILAAVALLFSVLTGFAQPGTTDLAYNETDSLYNAFHPASQEPFLTLYNGKQFYGYPSTIQGHAFFATREWSVGSVNYDGYWYRDVQLMYDVNRGEVVIRHPNGIPVILFSDRVKEFSYLGNTFVRMERNGKNGMPSGFYQVIERGRATLYALRAKKLEEKIDGTVLERKFIVADVFYILKDGQFFNIHNQQALFNALKDHRQPLQQYRRQQALRYRLDTEQFVTRLTEHYNQLNP